MNKRLYAVVAAVVIIFCCSLFPLMTNRNFRPLFRISGASYNSSSVEAFKRVYMKANGIDSLFSTSAAFEIIKDRMILSLCSLSGAGVSDSVFDGYAKMLYSDSAFSAMISSLDSAFGKEKVFYHFVKPLIAENLLSDRIQNDRYVIQKMPYSEASGILSDWDGKDCDKKFLTERTEYFLQKADDSHSSSASQQSIPQTKTMYEDNVYYYVALKEKDVIRGYRTRKIDFEEFASQFKGRFNLKFFDKSYERAFLMLSEGTIWGELAKINE